ncbi:MAG: tetratricopeptide repeat protein [Actinobacteria bacterium]|nr:tetratricopeptide repeat protein [Actinomycetota bacterium]
MAPSDDAHAEIARLLQEAARLESASDPSNAERVIYQALEAANRVDDLPLIAEAEERLAEVLWAQDRNDDAIRNLSSAQERFRALQDTDAVTHCGRLLGDMLVGLERYDEAVDRYLSVGAKAKAGKALWEAGSHDEAIRLLSDARAEYDKADSHGLIAAEIDREVGELLDSAARSVEAVLWLRRALAAYEENGDRFWSAIAHDSLADALDNTGAHSEASEHREAASALRQVAPGGGEGAPE